MSHIPPKRQPGYGRGPRTISGEQLDVRGTAARWFGGHEWMVRARVANKTLPHRRLGGRIVFLTSELERFFSEELPGVTLEQARANLAAKHGHAGGEL